MLIRTILPVIACLALLSCSAHSLDEAPAARSGASVHASAPAPLTIGETFTIDSRIMGEPRRVNVLVPTIYGQKLGTPMPVLYMPDGGADEDFLHVAGLVQVLVSNGGMRPFVLVGIQNTNRRRDMTGPTSNEEDRGIAPVVGGSATFRSFIREELMPTIRARYRTTGEAAVVGESLAGLFVIETFFLEPDLFNTYIAFDPSLWWADQELLMNAPARLQAAPARRGSVFVASSNEPRLAGLAAALSDSFAARPTGGIDFHYAPLPHESHATLYHPAALLAFRTVFAPPAPAGK
jgi:predicted alpha/beta superfamily hydrolase